MYLNILNFQIIATSDPIEFVHKNDCDCNITLSQISCKAHMKIGQVCYIIFESFTFIQYLSFKNTVYYLHLGYFIYLLLNM